MEYIKSIRPFTLSISAITVMLATAFCGQHMFQSEGFVRVLLMGLLMQAGGNLTNTYIDFYKGVDNKNSGERTLVESKLPASHVVLLSVVCYVLSAVAVWPFLAPMSSCGVDELCYPLRKLYLAGLCLTVLYTTLKYKALGGVAVMLCFGPILMQFAILVLTGSMKMSAYILSFVTGSLAWAMYHANDARDINSDTMAGVTTLATLLGYERSYFFFIFLVTTPFVATFILGTFFYWGCFVGFAGMPDGQHLIALYQRNKLENLPSEVHRLLILMSILLALGVMYTPNENFLDFSVRKDFGNLGHSFLKLLPEAVVAQIEEIGKFLLDV